ncbi:acyltransferase 3 [Xylaria intraflava]|nr:acyltransferase 3 [Xylaria intraflava]
MAWNTSFLPVTSRDSRLSLIRRRMAISRPKIIKFVNILTPSFTHTLWQDDISSQTAQPSSGERASDHGRTDYLDGLRGLAAFVVYIYHFLLPFDPTVGLGYNPQKPDTTSFMGLPILALLRSGTAMVRIFFGISGYVLTLSASKALHRGDGEAVLRSLSAAALKRGFRLFLPAVVTGFVIMLLVHAGLYTDASTISHFPAHWHPLRPVRHDSFFTQISDWLDFTLGRLTNPWRWSRDLFADLSASYYGAHLWTIQTEYHCSMILFLVAMILSRASEPRIRSVLWAIITVYVCLCDRWDVGMFLCGMAFADRDVQSNVAMSPETSIKPHWLQSGRRSRYLVSLAHTGILIAGLWLASYPERHGVDAIGFGALNFISHSTEAWQSIGAAMIVWSVGRLSLVRAFLTNTLVGYLGQLSFALYLVHEPILQAFGWLYTGMLRKYFILAGPQLGFSEEFGAQVGMGFAFLSLSGVVIIIADYIWRWVDTPSLILARKIGRLCIL